MKNNDIQRQIQARVDDFVSDLTELIHEAALGAVQDAVAEAGLGGSSPRRGRSTKKRSAKKRTTKARSTKKRASKKRGRRGSGPSPATLDKVAGYVKANPGLSVSEIAKGASSQLPATKKAVAHLLEQGALTKKGQRRGTRYFAK